MTDDPHAQQRDQWKQAVSAAKRQQRANRWRRKPKAPKPGMVRVQPPQARGGER